MSTTTKIRLLMAHTHNATKYPAGAVLEVPKRIGLWLIAQGVATAEMNAAARTARAPIQGRPCCGRSR